MLKFFTRHKTAVTAWAISIAVIVLFVLLLGAFVRHDEAQTRIRYEKASRRAPVEKCIEKLCMPQTFSMFHTQATKTLGGRLHLVHVRHAAIRDLRPRAGVLPRDVEDPRMLCRILLPGRSRLC